MGYEGFAKSTVTVAVSGFMDDWNQPRRALLHGIVLGSDADVAEGLPVLVTMEDSARDGNRLIKDLIHGSERFGVPRCEAGAVIEFSGCVFINDDEIAAEGYRVISRSSDIEVPEPPEGFVRDVHAFVGAAP